VRNSVWDTTSTPASRTWNTVVCSWSTSELDLKPLDYHVSGAMVQAFHKLHSKLKTIPGLKSALQQIWDDLPQTTINKSICRYFEFEPIRYERFLLIYTWMDGWIDTEIFW